MSASITKYSVAGLVAVLFLSSLTVIVTALSHTGSSELTTSLLSVDSVVVATLVGLLNSQLATIHTQMNSRLDQLVGSQSSAAFARGQLHSEGADPGPAHTPTPPST